MHSDELLWNKLKAGDRNAFEQLFRRYYKDLYRYGIKFCGDRQRVEDQIQNLFLKIWERKENLGDVKGVKTYLWVALRRDLITVIKKEDHRRKNEPHVLSEHSFSLSVEEFIIKSEQKKIQKLQIEETLKTLSPRQREVLYLRFYEGMSYEEIVEIMSVNYQVARNYLYKGLQSLKERLSTNVSVYLFFLFSVLGSVDPNIM